MADFKQFLKSISPQVQEVLKRIPDIIKVEGLDFIHDNFQNQGFEKSPGNVEKWQKRKPVKGRKGEQRSTGRAILVKSGNLQRAWDKGAKKGNMMVTFANDKPYAEPHNEGSKVQPKRMMIGDSTALDARIELKITKLMDELFKK